MREGAKTGGLNPLMQGEGKSRSSSSPEADSTALRDTTVQLSILLYEMVRGVLVEKGEMDCA